MIGGEDGDYILRVRGESMKDAGIFEGDYVVVRPAEEAADGEIVVALIGEEATVKRFYREADHVRLQPENEAMEPIRTTEAASSAGGRRLPQGLRRRGAQGHLPDSIAFCSAAGAPRASRIASGSSFTARRGLTSRGAASGRASAAGRGSAGGAR